MSEKPTSCKTCKYFYNACLLDNFTPQPGNAANVVVIGGSPTLFDVTKGTPFRAGTEYIIRQIIETAKQNHKSVSTYYTYAVKAPVRSVPIELVKQCKGILQKQLVRFCTLAKKPPILIILGQEALRSLDHPVEKITALFGKQVTIRLPSTAPGGTQDFRGFVLPSVDYFSRNIGIKWMYASIAQTALAATQNGNGWPTMEQLTKNYRIPHNLQELKQLIDEIIDYYDPERSSSKNPNDWWISLDTETNGLHPQWLEKPTITVVSVAWDTGKSAAIPLQCSAYSESDAWKEIDRLLSCPKPKIFHNWKFDMKFLELAYKKKVNNVYWDSMLGEHYLDEDKKGFYGLKKLVPFYLPEYQNYEKNISFDSEEAAPDERRRKFTKKQLLDAAQTAVNEQLEYHDIPLETWQEILILLNNKKNQQLNDLLKLHGLELVPERKNKPSTQQSDLLIYAATDADVTRQITRKQLQRAGAEQLQKQALQVMHSLYLPASRVIGKMEYYGVKINRSELEKMISDAAQRLKNIETEIKTNYDTQLNVRSPQQVARYMNRADFPMPDETTTSKDVLEDMLSILPENDPKRRFCRLVLEYREVHKVLYTYLIQLRDYAAKNGCIHCNFHLNGTATGRLSSSEPNMQNIPKIAARLTDTAGNVLHPGYNIKKIFIPRTPDMYIVNVDIRAAELRTYTAYSRDQQMAQILLNGQDPHSWVTAQVFKLPYETVVEKKDSDPEIKAMRTNCKRIIFGTLYGAGPDKVSKILKIPREEAQTLQRQIFAVLPALPQYIENVTQQIKNKRQLITYFGRCRRFSITKYSMQYFGDAIREGVNFLIQSTSSDLVLHSLCKLDAPLEKMGGRLLFSVHDSIVLELPKDKLPELRPLLDECIVDNIKREFPWLPVPFLYDVEYGENYGELKEVE